MKKIIIGLMMLCLCSQAWGQETMDVTLQWDANTESDLKGYGVHWDTDSGPPYGHHKDIQLTDDENPDPAVVEYTLTGLSRGTMYFFSVDAFDTEDLRSGFSNEISHDGIKHVPPGQSVLNFIKMRLSDGRIITVHSDGTIEVTLTDGTIIKVYTP